MVFISCRRKTIRRSCQEFKKELWIKEGCPKDRDSKSLCQCLVWDTSRLLRLFKTHFWIMSWHEWNHTRGKWLQVIPACQPLLSENPVKGLTETLCGCLASPYCEPVVGIWSSSFTDNHKKTRISVTSIIAAELMDIVLKSSNRKPRICGRAWITLESQLPLRGHTQAAHSQGPWFKSY